MQPNTVFLVNSEYLEFTPTKKELLTADERLAALLGYLTGDGTITSKSQSYTKKNGSVSRYDCMGGAFYSSVKEDLEKIRADLFELGIITAASVRSKKGKTPGYQLQISQSACEWFVRAGHPVGSKTAQSFRVPDWIMSADAGVKRAYVAALFGAEGTTPVKDRSSKSHFPKLPCLNMCKRSGVEGELFFLDLQKILADLGVAASVNVTGGEYKTYWLRILSGPENLIRFFEDVGYHYCDRKSELAWLWAKYLRAYQTEAKRRVETVTELAAKKVRYKDIAAELGMTESAVKDMLHRLRHGQEGGTCGHGFPHFDEWIAERWNEKRKVLRLFVHGKSLRPQPQTVWNMLVDSHDHSYVLASGANNFNSFETMSGRVYYPFDRDEHVGDYPFDPRAPIYIGMDFNIDPMSAVIIQEKENGEIWVVDEKVLYGSNAQEMADELARCYYRYFNQISIYPDPAGNNRNHDRGESSIEILREAGFKNIYFKRKHPLVQDRVNAVNRLLMTAEGDIRLRVDRKCRKLIDSLEQTIYKEGSREVDKSLGVEHVTDALGYYADFRHPIRKMRILGVSI
ncbi:hypothetical protein GCM10023174_10400 [Chelativorans composti]|uniref:LAGLIDADG family homing endonuclease n=1 Tax=Chelativorans composti TaxID=768533 RepID=A0ABW5DIW6_9HYPH